MYEWEINQSNPLKEFWSFEKNQCFKYLIRDDCNYLLRGSSAYYYFISNRISENGKDITSRNDVLAWHNNYIKFFYDANEALLETKDINSIFNKKLLLGILDNCRNVLLVIMNHKLVHYGVNDNILLDISLKENRTFFDIYDTLLKVEENMSNICFKSKFFIDKDFICSLVTKTKDLLIDNLRDENLSEEKDDYSKDYRAYREIDNFGENYTAVSLYQEKRNNKNDFINACGVVSNYL